MIRNDLYLAELLIAKFSHDISGPVGAVRNGVEFLSEDDFAMKDQAVSLISESANESVARIQFFRMAYGITKESGEANIDNLKKITENFFSYGKVDIKWSMNYSNGDVFIIDQNTAKIILNMLIIARSSILLDGNIELNIQEVGANELKINISATGSRIKEPDDYLILTNDNISGTELSTRNVQIYYTRLLLDYIKCKMESNITENNFELYFHYKRTSDSL